MAENVRWGIIGPGGIACEFFRGAEESPSGQIVAVGSRTPDIDALRGQFPGVRIHTGYEALLADRGIDAVYIATPHPFHAEWAIKALDAGKHVLCEKPAAMTAAEVEAMFAAASRNGKFLGEAMMYRFHPMTNFILDLLREGKIGDLRLIRSSFGFAMPSFLPNHRLFNKELGGGAILDVGGYPMSIVRLLAGYAQGRDDLEPAALTGSARYGLTGVDEIAVGTATFADGIIAQMSVSLSLWQDNTLHIMGTAGRLEVDDFWYGSGKTGGTAQLRYTPVRGETQVLSFSEQQNLYSFQFEAANDAIASGRDRFSYPGMTEADSRANARALDRWIREVAPAD
jgi:predicted dehydrogenase